MTKKLLRIELFLLKQSTIMFKNILSFSFQRETRQWYWFVGALQNYNEIYVPKSSSDGADLNRFG